VVAGLPPGLRRDRVIPLMLAALAVLLAAFGLSRRPALLLLFSTLAGGAMLAVTSLVNTSMQVAAPHGLRGRVMSLYVLAFMGQMPVASILSGVVGEAVGPANAVWILALPLLAWALLLVARPALLRPGVVGGVEAAGAVG